MKIPKYKSFPRKVQEQMAQELQAAADHITAKYGLSSATLYRHGSPTNFGIGISCVANNVPELINSTVASRTDEDLAKEQILLANAGLPSDAIGQEIYLSACYYVIVGVDERRSKYPWICIRKKDGLVRNFSEPDLIRRITTLRTYNF